MNNVFIYPEPPGVVQVIVWYQPKDLTPRDRQIVTVVALRKGKRTGLADMYALSLYDRESNSFHAVSDRLEMREKIDDVVWWCAAIESPMIPTPRSKARKK